MCGRLGAGCAAAAFIKQVLNDAEPIGRHGADRGTKGWQLIKDKQHIVLVLAKTKFG